MKHLCRRRTKPPARAGAVGGVVCRGAFKVQSIGTKNLGIGFLIFKWAKMARRERGLREPSRVEREG